MFKIEWDDTALCWKFYRGLKNDIKDEIARGTRLSILINIIIAAVQIDNRQYERRLKKDKKNNYRLLKNYKKQKPARKYYKFMLIKLNII